MTQTDKLAQLFSTPFLLNQLVISPTSPKRIFSLTSQFHNFIVLTKPGAQSR
jgi:hypothetical protein